MKDPILGHTENNQESPKKNSQDSVKKIKLDKNENFQIKKMCLEFLVRFCIGLDLSSNLARLYALNSFYNLVPSMNCAF